MPSFRPVRCVGRKPSEGDASRDPSGRASPSPSPCPPPCSHTMSDAVRVRARRSLCSRGLVRGEGEGGGPWPSFVPCIGPPCRVCLRHGASSISAVLVRSVLSCRLVVPVAVVGGVRFGTCGRAPFRGPAPRSAGGGEAMPPPPRPARPPPGWVSRPRRSRVRRCGRRRSRSRSFGGLPCRSSWWA